MRLLEYVLHPFNTFQGIFNYNVASRGVSTAGLGSKRYKERNKMQTPHWISQYFDSLNDSSRINLYAVYTEMNEDALVMSVLDTYAKACTQPNSESNREIAGRVVWCYSANKDVQQIINNFLDKMEVHETAFEIIRGMFQHGDHFEGIPGVRNEGIVRFDPYDPWQVAMLVDENRLVKGFGQSDDMGELAGRDTVIPFYEALHFRMPRRRRTDIYGARSSLLYGVREYWQDLQWCMDKVVIERLWRRPDRTMVLLDVGGTSSEDAFDICEEYRDRMYRDMYFNPGAQELMSMPAAWSESRDFFLPTGADNKTSITSAPASSSSGPLDDLYFFLRRFFGGLKFPPGYLGLDLGDNYDPASPLEKQDLGFAQNCMGPQRAFLRALTRAGQIHLGYHNLDPRFEKNRFMLLMNPINTFQEIERKELIGMRFDLMDRAMSMGRDNEWNMDFWAKYVMQEYAHLPGDMVDTLLAKTVDPEDTEAAMNQGDEGENLFADKSKNTDEYKRLMEAVDKNPKMAEALVFFSQGGAMVSSASVRVPERLEEMCKRKVESKRPIFDGTFFEKKTTSRKEERVKIRRQLYERAMQDGRNIGVGKR